jgi:lipopolysaccharide biosynthesis regulator YciM
MAIELNWILLGLPLAFGLGWMASRLDLRQLRIENRQSPKAYFKGLNFLLNEQQDQAIDAFIEAVQHDPDTSELHFALGNLFRRRGEFERAVRVHEHLLARGDLSNHDRQRAQHALGMDFLRAGLLDRAESALCKLEGTPLEEDALLCLLSIYERTRDWPLAAQVSRKLDAKKAGSFSGRLAHYLCEQAQAFVKAEDTTKALTILEEAIELSPQSARPRLERAQLQMDLGQHAAAFQTLHATLEAIPAANPLTARLLSKACIGSNRVADGLQALKDCYEKSPSLDVIEAIVELEDHLAKQQHSARAWYVKHLERMPSLVAATQWIAGEKLEHNQYHPLVQRALDHAVKPLQRYRCAACGFEAKQHFWQCPGCQAWDSYPARRVEEL